MSTEDVRKSRRHVFASACIARSSRDGRLLGDRALDLSYAGMRIAAVGDARLGERVDLSLQIPGSNVWVHAQGRIERVIPGRRAGDTGPAFGVRVDRMDGMSRVFVASIAQSFPEAAGGRGPERDYAGTVQRIDNELSA